MTLDASQFLSSGASATDAFGFDTPEGAEAKRKARFAQRRDNFFSSSAAQNHGRQVGQALADIFGAPVRQALDTATARKDEQDRLIATGLDPKQAREAAKASISPEFAGKRRAMKIEQLGAGAQGAIDSLIEQGVPAARAQAVGMLQMARRLEQSGFRQEATQMRVQGSEMLQAQEEREAALDKIKATTDSSRANTDSTRANLAADDDTFVRFDTNGNIDGIESVRITSPKRRDELRADGYINIGNSGIGIDVDGDALNSDRKVVSNEVQENIRAQTEMLASLDVLEGVTDQTGLIEGPFRGLAAKLGFAEDGFIQAIAVKDKMEADIQSMIKGIPSNYDAEIFQKQIPDPTKFQSTDLYQERVRLLRNNVERALEITIAFHKGTDKEFPQEVLWAMERFGVDPATINPMTKDQAARATQAHNNIMSEQTARLDAVNPQPDNNPAASRQALLERARRARENQ